MHSKNIIGLIVSQFMYSLYSLLYRLISYPYSLDTTNSNKMIFNVIAIGLQFFLNVETDTIMRSNVALHSYAAYSCYIHVLFPRVYGLDCKAFISSSSER